MYREEQYQHSTKTGMTETRNGPFESEAKELLVLDIVCCKCEILNIKIWKLCLEISGRTLEVTSLSNQKETSTKIA